MAREPAAATLWVRTGYTNWISSSIFCSLHQKPKEVITFRLIFFIELHQMQAGTVLHHFFWLLLLPLLIQQLNKSAGVLAYTSVCWFPESLCIVSI